MDMKNIRNLVLALSGFTFLSSNPDDKKKTAEVKTEAGKDAGGKITSDKKAADDEKAADDKKVADDEKAANDERKFNIAKHFVSEVKGSALANFYSSDAADKAAKELLEKKNNILTVKEIEDLDNDFANDKFKENFISSVHNSLESQIYLATKLNLFSGFGVSLGFEYATYSIVSFIPMLSLHRFNFKLGAFYSYEAQILFFSAFAVDFALLLKPYKEFFSGANLSLLAYLNDFFGIKLSGRFSKSAAGLNRIFKGGLGLFSNFDFTESIAIEGGLDALYKFKNEDLASNK